MIESAQVRICKRARAPEHVNMGLANFFMAGQWITPGGGLPGGLMSARAAVRDLCAQDHVPFLSGAHRVG